MIRAANYDDLPALLDMGRLMHAESYYGRFPYDAEKIEALLRVLIDGEGCVFLYERDGRLIGYFLGMLGEHWFGHSTLACDLALYVLPDERGTLAAPSLIKAFVRWAKSVGADDVQLAISTDVHANRTARLFEGFGFRSVGGIYKQGAH